MQPTVQASDLDLSIEIKNDKIHTSLFDKRDVFGFIIVNVPDLIWSHSRNKATVYSYHRQFAMHVVVRILQTFAREFVDLWFDLSIKAFHFTGWRKQLKILQNLTMKCSSNMMFMFVPRVYRLDSLWSVFVMILSL